jgi:hypothetical protein
MERNSWLFVKEMIFTDGLPVHQRFRVYAPATRRVRWVCLPVTILAIDRPMNGSEAIEHLTMMLFKSDLVDVLRAGKEKLAHLECPALGCKHPHEKRQEVCTVSLEAMRHHRIPALFFITTLDCCAQQECIDKVTTKFLPIKAAIYERTQMHDASPRFCSCCGLSEDPVLDEQVEAKMLLCTRCTKVYYCNTVCQKMHWPRHKPFCTKKTEGLRKVAPSKCIEEVHKNLNF